MRVFATIAAIFAHSVENIGDLVVVHCFALVVTHLEFHVAGHKSTSNSTKETGNSVQELDATGVVEVGVFL